MVVWIASSNQGKINEFKSLLFSKNIELKTPKNLKNYFSPKETGETFEENARIKARSLRSMVDGDSWVVAEDSGLGSFRP
ncbi:MAG: non-canonical purine NTP pyrophosphatase [Bdellovibrionales bacterium]